MTVVSPAGVSMENPSDVTRHTIDEDKQETMDNQIHAVRDDNGSDAKDEVQKIPERKASFPYQEKNAEIKDLPILTIEPATPLPPPQTPDINNNNNNDDGNNNTITKSHLGDPVKEEEEEDGEDMSDEGGEEEEVEEEEEDLEMTTEEKKDMHECVKSGDIDSLEDCLDLPHADINMTWFRENLLMTAIRYGQKEMAEFLLDNGVDHTYTTSIVGMRETGKGKVLERYQLNCRQMAYDKEMFDIVDLIDSLQGQLFPFVRLPERTPRFRRPKPPTPTESETGSDESSSEGADISSDDELLQREVEGLESRSQDYELKQLTKKRRKKKKKAAKDNVGADGEELEQSVPGKGDDDEEDDDGDGERDKTIGAGSGADVDSGHHSLASSKLKVAMLKEHNRLMEKEEREEEIKERRGKSQGGSSGNRGSSKARVVAADDAKEKTGSLKSRAQSEGKSNALGDEEGSAGGEHNKTQDEGYGGSASFHSGAPGESPQQIPPSEQLKPWNVAPKNRIRSTKSALTVRRLVNLRYGRRVLSGASSLPSRYSETGFSSSIPINFEDDIKDDVSNLPLRWRKVSTAGSYSRESRQWHQAHSNESQEESSPGTVEISEIKLISPTSSSSHFTAEPLSQSDNSLGFKSTALPKSIGKSSAPATTTSASLGPDRSSSTSGSDLSSINGRSVKTASQSQTSSSPSQTAAVAGYMRATKSTAIKCRLSPRFAHTYGAMDFHSKPGSSAQASRSSASKSPSPVSPEAAAVSRASTTKRYHIPVLVSDVSEHQKRNRNAISFRS
ncbi:hypothetical protein PoB_007058800 [Plakobranchus ocellatus]|uniref:Uncharacterized protein n=1 Tax=Plakobranchus ocellatus TaxID=259542 RepID=A0AAV4DIN7_9GAST|nr:hypothetical protein PoB_007058800 [Plakobranchus ocellatus]